VDGFRHSGRDSSESGPPFQALVISSNFRDISRVNKYDLFCRHSPKFDGFASA
jgi:hypothetical protein